MHIYANFCLKFVRTHNTHASHVKVAQSTELSQQVKQTVCAGHSKERWVTILEFTFLPRDASAERGDATV